MNVQALPKILSDIYAVFDSLNLSVTALVMIAIGLTIVFLFAAREAASWFFKIEDLKKDVKKVRQLIVDIEGEVRTLQNLLSQNIELANAQKPAASPAKTVAAAVQPTAAGPQKQRAEEKPQPRFNLQH